MEFKIKVPKNLSDLKLGDYQNFRKFQDGSEDEIFLRKKAIEIFCKMPPDFIDLMELSDFQDVSNRLVEVLSLTNDVVPTFTMDGVEYGLLPNISDDLTVGEYVDADTFLGKDEDLHKFMAVFYRPVTKKLNGKYLIEPYVPNKYLAEMKNCPMDVVKGISVFFCTIVIELASSIQNFLANPKITREVVRHLGTNGVGTNSFTSLLAESSLTLTELSEKKWGKLLHFSLTTKT